MKIVFIFSGVQYHVERILRVYANLELLAFNIFLIIALYAIHIH